VSVVKAKTNSDRHTALAILRASDFPNVPKDDQQALNVLAQSDVYLVGDEPSAVVVFFDSNMGRMLDIACLPTSRGKWASRSVLRLIHQELVESGVLRSITGNFSAFEKMRGLCYEVEGQTSKGAIVLKIEEATFKEKWRFLNG
jgi:hypothetical protein